MTGDERFPLIVVLVLVIALWYSNSLIPGYDTECEVKKGENE